MIYQADLSVCWQKVSLLAPLVYSRACPKDRLWDHFQSSYISTVFILETSLCFSSKVKIETSCFQLCLCWTTAMLYACMHLHNAYTRCLPGSTEIYCKSQSPYLPLLSVCWVGWSALSNRCHILIYKAILGLLPSYLWSYIQQKSKGSYYLHSQDIFLLTVPKVLLNRGKGRSSMLLPRLAISCKMSWIFWSWSHWTHRKRL